MKRPAILLHKDELGPVGLDLQPISSLNTMQHIPHRDDHYMFVLLQAGSFAWEVDFNRIVLRQPSVCFIAPGQVHHYLDFKRAKGWFVFIDSPLISSQCRNILDSCLHICQSAGIDKGDTLFTLVPALDEVLNGPALALKKSLAGSLSDTLAALVASKLVQAQHTTNLVGGQKYHTFVHFKQMINTRYREMKQVKAYAAALHITPLYLNEVVKEITGFPASYWIHQEVLLEAKRMLCYTAMDVKQIAYDLGYEDHAYFSRFFKRHAGMTALAFRDTKPLFVQS
ncbi:helix-turn-helix domain-containing protein [Taibaiella chishuiensis]|uniref:AraC family transcriptional regulator n=1 Tax=Taibaiella chishuiensis TaxID=1434707 RepID=A0A2P8D1Y8_9BACT|nr:helix-turn-helix domain-containing protein [Taibaiella chishuiensis]PSK91186.1 AraC family transcriptional regulator [Taibaiella chishuiensis]